MRSSRNKGVYALTIEDKLEKYTRLAPNGCIEWVGGTNPKGYGTTTYKNQAWLAHRLMYTVFVGPIPSGMVIDHLCRNPSCVNHKHLEAVTNEENLARGLRPWGHKPVTHCPRGHEYTEGNINWARNGARHCKRCQRISHLKHYKARKPETRARNAEVYAQLTK